MKKELFDELLKSVEQGGEIMKRTMKPARTFTFAESEASRLGKTPHLAQQNSQDVGLWCVAQPTKLESDLKHELLYAC